MAEHDRQDASCRPQAAGHRLQATGCSFKLVACSLKPEACKGQSLIEFTLALLVALLMFGGTVKLWLWFNRSLVWRQRAYDDTRWWNARRGWLPGKLDYYKPEKPF